MPSHFTFSHMSSGEIDEETGEIIFVKPPPESAPARGEKRLNNRFTSTMKTGRCRAAKESPQIIAQKLRELDANIEKLPAESKKSLLLAQEKCPELLTDDFRLRFLRTEVLDPARAAGRYAYYWELRINLFKENAFRPLTMSEEEDLAALRSGVVQTIPGHERVLMIDTARLNPSSSVDSLAKTQWYVFTKALDGSTEIQRYGGIFLIDLHHSFTHLDLLKQISSRANDGFPLRCASACLLNPPRFVGPLLKVAKWFLRPRVRDKIHVINTEQQFLDHVGVSRTELEESGMENHHIQWVDRMLSRDRQGK